MHDPDQIEVVVNIEQLCVMLRLRHAGWRNCRRRVVANQIAVIPPGVESEAKAVNSDLDNGYREELGRCSHPKQASKECQI